MSELKKIKQDHVQNLVEDTDQSLQSATHSTFAGEQTVHQKKYDADNAPKFIGGKYRVIQLLGQGGMGAVYKVHHVALDKTFAAKVLNSNVLTDFKLLQRFDQEAKSVGTLNHPNLIAVHDYGTSDDGTPYLIMDFLDGHSLDEELKQNGPLEEKRALHIFALVCDALKHAHEKGIIHRDIKPSNIMLVRAEDGKESIKIVDFGIAKRELVDNKVTQTGEVFGTPLYMSPEQCLGKTCDARSDIYSIGCVMYEALTGIAPFAAENAVQTIFNHLNEKPPPLRKANPGLEISAAIEQLVAACLEKEPKDRIGSAENIAANLRRIERGQNPILNAKSMKVKKETAFKVGNFVAYSFAILFVMICGFEVFVLNQKVPPYMKMADQGLSDYNRADYIKAAISFEEGLKLARAENAPAIEQVKFLRILTNCYAYSTQYQKASLTARTLAELQLKNNELQEADTYANRTWEYLRGGDKDKYLDALNFAINVREKAFSVDSPLLFEPVLQRAGAYRVMGKTEKAIEDMERALKLAKSAPKEITIAKRFDAYSLLSSYLARIGNNQRSLEIVNEALSSPSGAPPDALRTLEHRRKQLLEVLSK